MQTSSAYSDPTLSSFSPELPRDVSCTLSPAETFPLIEDPSHGAVPDDILFPDGRSRQRLEVPDVITAHTWFFRRYRLNLYAALNTLLRSGELRMMTGFDFRNRVINRGCCGFPSVTFRDNGRSSFLAEVRADLDLDTGERTRRWSGMLTLTFTAADGQFTGVMSDFQPLDQYTGRPNAPLSPFLIPYAKSADLDRLGEELWEQYLPEALTKPELRSGEALARAMGLTVRYEPLRDLPGTDSLIFFAPGELEAGKEGEAARTVRIPARTIVVNTSRIRPEHADYAIFHECIHDRKHYLFFCLQQVWNNDPRRFRMKTVTVRPGDTVTDPLYWMEKQANRGAYALLLPAAHTRSLIRACIASAPACAHRGYLMEYVIRKLWETVYVPYFRLRARMIQMGWPEAKGAVNFVDGRWIQPFAFDQDALDKEELTFVISQGEVEQMRKNYPAFRELLEHGEYIWADGHVVRRDQARPWEPGINLLSPEANARVDQYCLRFYRVYERRHVGKYVPGRMNFDADYARRTAFFLEDLVNSRQLDELDAREEYIRTFPATFREGFDLLMRKNGMTREDAAEALHLHPRTLYRMLKEPEKSISRDFVVTTALLWQLPDWLTELLMDRACILFRETDKRHRALKYIMRVMWMDGVEKANEYLKSMDLAPLSV